MRLVAASKVRRLVLGTLVAFVASAGLAGSASAAFTPGVVSVTGYNWKTQNPRVDVSLDQLSGSPTYTVEEILDAAEGQAGGQFDLATIPGIEVDKPDGTTVGCSGNDIRSGRDSCPVFKSDATTTYMVLAGGSGKRISYTTSNPVIYITRQKDLKVTVDPAKKTINSGETVPFVADVENEIGDLTYEWDFGDGTSRVTSVANVSHRFVGNDEEFAVILTVTDNATNLKTSNSALVTVGKVKKKPRKEHRPKPREDSGGGNNGGYDSGYGSGYEGGYGTGTGTGTGTGGGPSGSQGTNPPKAEKRQEEPQPAGSTGQTVSGQLIDPAATVTVVPPAETPAAGNGESSPEAKPDGGGGGISKGAITAFGIGALLGLGGLAEAGAFAGHRRFRFRP